MSVKIYLLSYKQLKFALNKARMRQFENLNKLYK